jgi:hypothetical protein
MVSRLALDRMAQTDDSADGGVNMLLMVNGKAACDSKAEYGGKLVEGKASDGTKWESISGMGHCTEIPINKGDVLSMQANYDVDRHPEYVVSLLFCMITNVSTDESRWVEKCRKGWRCWLEHLCRLLDGLGQPRHIKIENS